MSSIFANSSNGMAFFLIFVAAQILCSSLGEGIDSGLFADGAGVWSCDD